MNKNRCIESQFLEVAILNILSVFPLGKTTPNRNKLPNVYMLSNFSRDKRQVPLKTDPLNLAWVSNFAQMITHVSAIS